MLFQLKSYIKFLLRSTNLHGIHSPFIYDLTSNCFYDKTKKRWYKVSYENKQNLLNNQNTIIIQDFGAGSKKLQSNKRSISKIAKNAGISQKRAQLLGRIIQYLNVNHVLEIGTSLGIATTSMSLAKPDASILTLEGCKNTAQIAKNSFKNFNLNNIKIEIGNFSDTLPKALNNKVFDLIYFDGNHQKVPTLDYFQQALKHIHNDSIFIFDDIYWSKDMLDAWNTIKEHSKVTISIDTFYWGIVFFRNEQQKQHFTIRI